ncbi:metallophosphoesterase family protein [Bhargavaea ginsengi]|uniref:metallophosphoesterase family protein n=1 Tax=Bhargavaea ginsengi TaxID=426757 RepID=UPI003C76081B
MTIRFIHAADLHLGSPFKGFAGLPGKMAQTVRESTFTAFRNLISHAAETRPDFLLIAGDIYDGEDRSLRAQEQFRMGMETLREKGVPVFVSHGNHDHLAGSWVRFSLPDNVHVFGPQVETAELNVRGTTVKIHGFSYPERHMTEPVIRHYPQGMGDAVEIGMLHGSIRGNEAHDVYAPFTKDELLGKGYDYWALGHIHKRQVLHAQPPIVYPGSLQGLHRKESGIKGFYEVEIGQGTSSLEFIPAGALVFGTAEINCAGIRHADQWLERCMHQIRAFREADGPGLLDLRLTGIDEGAEAMFSDAPESEWLEFIRECVMRDCPDIGVHRMTWERDTALAVPGGLFRDVLEELGSWDADNWKDCLADLYGHRQAYRFTGRLGEEEIREIAEEAERLITDGLMKGGRAE